jgi:hypothetical protein
MRKLVVLGGAAVAASVAAAFAVAGGGHAASRAGLAAAVAKTEAAPSMRYRIHVRLTRDGVPMALHVRGQAGLHTVSVAMRMSDFALDDGTVVPGQTGAALLDGPFLYERAPSSIAAVSRIRWKRLAVWTLPAGSPDLAAIRSMSPTPLLRVLRAAHTQRAAGSARAVRASIAYDDRAVRRLEELIGNLEFRHLRLSAVLGRDGRVHRIVLTGRTADGSTTLSLRARLFGFGKPVHVTLPKPGTFVDQQLAQIPA